MAIAQGQTHPIPCHGTKPFLRLRTCIARLDRCVCRSGVSAGRLGVISFALLLTGSSLASWVFSSDVTYVPVIATKSPALFQHINSGSNLLIGMVSDLAGVFGTILFGISVIRAKVFSRWTGILLVMETIGIPIAYLTEVHVKAVAGAAIIAGIGQLWLGYELLRILRQPTPLAQAK